VLAYGEYQKDYIIIHPLIHISQGKHDDLVKYGAQTAHHVLVTMLLYLVTNIRQTLLPAVINMNMLSAYTRYYESIQPADIRCSKVSLAMKSNVHI